MNDNKNNKKKHNLASSRIEVQEPLVTSDL